MKPDASYDYTVADNLLTILSIGMKPIRAKANNLFFAVREWFQVARV